MIQYLLEGPEVDIKIKPHAWKFEGKPVILSHIHFDEEANSAAGLIKHPKSRCLCVNQRKRRRIRSLRNRITASGLSSGFICMSKAAYWSL